MHLRFTDYIKRFFTIQSSYRLEFKLLNSMCLDIIIYNIYIIKIFFIILETLYKTNASQIYSLIN